MTWRILNASLILRHPNFKIPQRNQILLPLMPLIDHLNLNGLLRIRQPYRWQTADSPPNTLDQPLPM